MKDSLILYTAYGEKFKKLTDEQFGKLTRLMIHYQMSGETPEITDPLIELSFDAVKYDIDANNEKYEKVVQRNKQNGAKGGRPRNPEEPKKPSGFLENPKNPDEPKKADNDNDNDNDNDIENEKVKDKSFSFSQKKEKIIFDFSLVLLSEGRPNAYAEAREAYEYNDATGWTTETTKPNGDVTTKKITNPISWLKGWKRSNEQMFAPSEGYLYSKIFEGYSSIKRENECLINAFRGIRQISDDGVELLFCNKKAIDIFQSIFENDKAFNTRVCATIRGRYPKAENIFYKVV